MKVAVLIPAYNEAGVIGETLTAVQRIEQVREIVVIDDGSTDNTAEVVRQNGAAKLLSLQRNSGKGAALNWGWRQTKADIYLLLDADLGQTAILAGELLIPIFAQEADLTVARFDFQQVSGAGQMGFGLVRNLASYGVRLLTGQSVTSPLSGQRAVKAQVLESLGGFLPGFGVEVGLTVGALQQGFKLQEIPLPMKHRAYGRGWKGIIHRGRQLGHVGRALWRCRQRGR